MKADTTDACEAESCEQFHQTLAQHATVLRAAAQAQQQGGASSTNWPQPSTSRSAQTAALSPLSCCTPGTQPPALSLPGHITLHVCDNMFEGSTGCHAWEAGYALAEYVLSYPELFQGKSLHPLLDLCSCCW